MARFGDPKKYALESRYFKLYCHIYCRRLIDFLYPGKRLLVLQWQHYQTRKTVKSISRLWLIRNTKCDPLLGSWRDGLSYGGLGVIYNEPPCGPISLVPGIQKILGLSLERSPKVSLESGDKIFLDN